MESMKCDLCKMSILDKQFSNFYNYRGGKFKRDFKFQNDYQSYSKFYTKKYDLLICCNCFIFRNLYFNDYYIIVPEYLPIEQHKKWLKGHLLN